MQGCNKIILKVLLFLSVASVHMLRGDTEKQKNKRMSICIEFGKHEDNDGPVLFALMSGLAKKSFPVLTTYQLLKAWQNQSIVNNDALEKSKNALKDLQNNFSQQSFDQNQLDKCIRIMRDGLIRSNRARSVFLPVSLKDFDIYHVPNSAWFLFVPKGFDCKSTIEFTENNEKKIIKVSLLKLSMLEKFQTNETTLLNDLISWADQCSGVDRHGVRLLNKVFFTTKDLRNNEQIDEFINRFGITKERESELIDLVKSSLAQWTFFLVGHGSPHLSLEDETQKGLTTVIAGLRRSEFQLLLRLFNRINTEFVAIVSCYAGGKNLDYIKFKQDLNESKIVNDFNYTLAVISSGDNSASGFSDVLVDVKNGIPQYMQGPGALDSEAFFNVVEKKSGAHWLTDALEFLSRSVDNFFSENIPQIWIPRTGWFQTFLPPRTKLLSELIKLRKKIEGKQNNLVNKKQERARQNELKVLNERIEKIEKEKLFLSAYQEQDIIFLLGNVMLKKHYLEGKKINIENKGIVLVYPDVVPAALRITPRDFTSDLKMYRRRLSEISNFPMLPQRKNSLFPKFLSMQPGASSSVISSVELINTKFDKYAGVFAFIFESFFDLANFQFPKTFVIRSLTGLNDFSPLLKQERTRLNQDVVSNFETVLKSHENERITLNDVWVFGSEKSNGDSVLLIIFKFNDTFWKLVYRKKDNPVFNVTFEALSPDAYQGEIIGIDSIYLDAIYKDLGVKTVSDQLEELKDEEERASKPIPAAEVLPVESPEEPAQKPIPAAEVKPEASTSASPDKETVGKKRTKRRKKPASKKKNKKKQNKSAKKKMKKNKSRKRSKKRMAEQ